jgi:ankyrin repeat protein
MSTPPNQLPPRPSLEQLRKQAKDLARAGRAAGKKLKLSAAQLEIARQFGFTSWPDLVHFVQATAASAPFQLRPLIRPVELTSGRTFSTPDGNHFVADDVFEIFQAARGGDIATVRRLVSATPALATVEYNYTPPMHFAVREGYLPIVEFLLDRGASVGYRSYPFSDTLLEIAQDRGHADVAELLLRWHERGGIVAAKTTELHEAAHHQDVGKVRELLARGSKADRIRGDGYRPIHLALMRNWIVGAPSARGIEIAELLLAAGAKRTVFVAALLGDMAFVRDAVSRNRALASAEDTCHHRPLTAAVRRGDVVMTKLLLDHGANPSLPEEGAPRGLALWIAVDKRHRELVQLLLEHGADANGEVDSSGTPMGHAQKDAELVALLRTHGGRVREPDADRDDLEKLFASGDLKAVERKLRENPELLREHPANWGEGILGGPASAGRHDAIAMLMRLGVQVPKVTKWAPYYYFKHENTARFLLEHGMDPNHMNWHRFTLLHHMAADGELGKARALIEHGADIDAIDDEYRSTPLGVAARRGQEGAAKLLIESGADTEHAGAPWATPLAWAERAGHARIAQMIRDEKG